jgi:hypothetical protein
MTEELFVVKEEKALPPVNTPLILQQKEENSRADFSYLGENNKYFLILVNDEKHTHLNKELQEMLIKIIQAKALELRDVAILNLRRYSGIQFKALKDFFAPSRVVLFGIDPRIIGLPGMGSNEPEKVEDVKALATYHLEEMKNDVAKKRAFWNVLKSF